MRWAAEGRQTFSCVMAECLTALMGTVLVGPWEGGLPKEKMAEERKKGHSWEG